MNNRAIITTIVIIILIAALGFAWSYKSKNTNNTNLGNNNNASSTSGNNNPNSLTLAGGEVSLIYPNDKLALAVSKNQILVHPYIPPCDDNFDYCFYYNGNSYSGTNFESAGLRIKKRSDLGNERLCLNTPPEGFSASTEPDKTNSTSDYSTSIFSNVGGAAAGHYSTGSLYRLFVRSSSSCYEFETRIGNSQISNYPSGTIREFTSTDQNDVKNILQSVLDSLKLVSTNSRISF